MIANIRSFILSSIIIILLNISAFSQQDSSQIKKIISKTELSGKWYLVYNSDLTNKTNQFALKRGYFTIKSKLSEQISVRYTQDITIDKEGTDAGNIEVRIKYLYLKLKPFKTGALKNSYTEIGLAHRPFVDFEQHINDYRSQGKMYIEKVGIVNTAGFGVLYSGLIGGKISKSLQNKVGKHCSGKYGSFSLGVFNGGGYHSLESNNNKTIEGRLTIRPLPNVIPEVQLTYAGIYGKGNDTTSPDFNMNLGAITYQSPNFVLTGQYFSGKGNYKGTYFDDLGYAAENSGYSFFSEFKIPKTSFALFGRYDTFSSNQVSDYLNTGYFGGITYRFLKSKIFAYYGQDIINTNKTETFEIVLDITF